MKNSNYVIIFIAALHMLLSYYFYELVQLIENRPTKAYITAKEIGISFNSRSFAGKNIKYSCSGRKDKHFS